MTELIQRLDKFISSKQLIKDDDTLLITVSGGIDSMFLLNYLVNKNYKLAVAHCNFGLRGKESDGDEALVKSYCEAHNIKFHVKKFKTELHSKTKGISIQMAARDLRYHWFNELCEAEKYTKIVTAHHKTDNAETILLNLVRGTGLKGMEGIAEVAGNKIRPLLCLNRDEIEQLVQEQKINYREDSSNLSDKYYRNRLRHHVLPQLQAINPSFENTLKTNADIVIQANSFINHFIEIIKKDVLELDKNSVIIDISKLLKWPEPQFVLYNLLAEFGFNSATVEDVFNSLAGQSGKQFFSETHRLILNRHQLIIEPISHLPFQSFVITQETKTIETPHHHWQFEIVVSNLKFQISNLEAQFDYEKLVFPLILRRWQLGDKIKPLGMKGHKKVSDILIDKKLSISEKEKIWVLISDYELVWVSGLVVSEDYKVNPITQQVLGIKLNFI